MAGDTPTTPVRLRRREQQSLYLFGLSVFCKKLSVKWLISWRQLLLCSFPFFPKKKHLLIMRLLGSNPVTDSNHASKNPVVINVKICAPVTIFLRSWRHLQKIFCLRQYKLYYRLPLIWPDPNRFIFLIVKFLWTLFIPRMQAFLSTAKTPEIWSDSGFMIHYYKKKWLFFP